MVYILQTSSTRDGLFFDYFCKDLDSLKELAKARFREWAYPDNIEIKEVIISPLKNISIIYFDGGKKFIYNKYSYITVNVL